MKILRNPEVRTLFVVFGVLSTILTLIGFCWGIASGILVGATCILFFLFFLLHTMWRYRRIARLSMELDRILHEEERFCLEEYAEGELAILQNELSKMTIRLREHAGALQREKRFLTDSIADISHQLRTPLTTMNLIASGLQQPDLPEERRNKLIQELTLLLSRVDWLISALLKMSRIDSGTADFRRESVSVGQLIQKASEALLIPMELRSQIFTFVLEGTPHYLGDFAWSVEAVGNILKNCMEHTPAGGSIWVHGAENAIYTELVLEDNGDGLDPADIPHLFERFYRGKNAGDQSVGIGLSLARMIITEQNGTVKAENRPEGGARFIIRFYKSVV